MTRNFFRAMPEFSVFKAWILESNLFRHWWLIKCRVATLAAWTEAAFFESSRVVVHIAVNIARQGKSFHINHPSSFKLRGAKASEIFSSKSKCKLLDLCCGQLKELLRNQKMHLQNCFNEIYFYLREKQTLNSSVSFFLLDKVQKSHLEASNWL